MSVLRHKNRQVPISRKPAGVKTTGQNFEEEKNSEGPLPRSQALEGPLDF